MAIYISLYILILLSIQTLLSAFWRELKYVKETEVEKDKK